jgi:surfactin synthase thioesterase subunit
MRLLPGDHFFLHSAQALILQMLTEELHQQPKPGAQA